jgi:hypothetical protein
MRIQEAESVRRDRNRRIQEVDNERRDREKEEQEVENKRRVQEVELGEGCFGRGLGNVYILRKGKGKPSQETGSKSNKAAKT